MWIILDRSGLFAKDVGLQKYQGAEILNQPESKTKECANFKFEVKSCVK